MFIKKLLGSSNDGRQEKGKNDRAAPPQGVQTMGVNLQRKFAKGVQYNMKIVIKGDRNVGKTCLFCRLQGHKFKEEYLPTDEIQATSIQWNYKATDDIVKVEVWDVVDRGKRRKKSDSLKLDTHHDLPSPTSDPWADRGVVKPPSQQASAAGTNDPCLDAEFLDVYKGTHGVIMMFDVTKQWTFSYVERELPKVPSRIPVLVLANHRDMGHHRTVSEDSVHYFIEEQRQEEDAADIRYAEASMRNGYGLKYIHKFFNLPFLQLQRETLLRQLKTNSRERELTVEELSLQEGSEDQNYELYLESLTAKKPDQDTLSETNPSARIQPTVAPPAIAPTTNGCTATPAATPGGLRQAPPPHTIPGLMVTTSLPTATPPSGNTAARPASTAAPPGFMASKSAPVTPAATPQQEAKSGGFISRLFGNKNKEREKKEQEQRQQHVTAAVEPTVSETSIRDVHDFVPLDQLDTSFLDDATEARETTRGGADQESDSDDDESTSNPLVAGFQDDVDSDDQHSPGDTAAFTNTHAELSSDEEEEIGKHSRPVVASSRDSVLDSDSTSKSLAQLPIQWTLGGSTSHDNRGSKMPHEEISIVTTATPVSVVDSDSDDSDDAGNVVMVTAVQNEVSDDEVTTIVDRSVVDGAPTPHDATQEGSDHSVDPSSDPPDTSHTDISPPVPTLQFDDFAFLDHDLNGPTGLPRVESLSSDMTASSSRAGSDMECATRRKKKHRSKDKDKESGEKDRKKKHRKHREKGVKEGKEGSEESRKKRSSRLKPEGNEMDDLEAFLGPGGDSAAKTSDYEVL